MPSILRRQSNGGNADSVAQPDWRRLNNGGLQRNGRLGWFQHGDGTTAETQNGDPFRLRIDDADLSPAQLKYNCAIRKLGGIPHCPARKRGFQAEMDGCSGL